MALKPIPKSMSQNLVIGALRLALAMHNIYANVGRQLTSNESRKRKEQLELVVKISYVERPLESNI